MNIIYSIFTTLFFSLNLQAETIQLEQGEKLPSARAGYKWQFMHATDNEPVQFVYELVRASNVSLSNIERALDGLQHHNTRYELIDISSKETKEHLIELVERDYDIDFNISHLREDYKEIEEYCNYVDTNEDGELWLSNGEWSLKWKMITKWVGRQEVVQGYIGVVLVSTWSLDSEEERFCNYPRMTFLFDDNYYEVEEPFSLLEILDLKK